MMTTPLTEKRTKERTKITGEVFTPIPLVLEMLDKLSEDSWQPDKNFLDNSCGHGNFLTEIVKRKIQKGLSETQALKTTYGIDLMPDNVEECRERLLEVAGNTKEHTAIVNYNIVCHDALNGWDYDNWCEEKSETELKEEQGNTFFDF